MVRLIISVAVVLLYSKSVCGQQTDFLSNDNFAFKVKQIDEFIERFNNAQSTLIKDYVREHYSVDSLSRAALIISLFNQEDTTWDEAKVRAFVDDVTQETSRRETSRRETSPENSSSLLDFYDGGWYAELDCLGQYRGKTEHFTLVLSLEVLPQGRGSKWVINGVEADFLGLGYDTDRSRTLNPASHDTDFMNLIVALQDTVNFRNYLSARAQPSQLLLFLDELCEGHLVFKNVQEITYHFLQIDNWIFKVRDFNRNNANSGWLISELMQVTDAQKLQYQKKMLYLN